MREVRGMIESYHLEVPAPDYSRKDLVRWAEGKARDDLAEEYGLSMSEVNSLIMGPVLRDLTRALGPPVERAEGAPRHRAKDEERAPLPAKLEEPKEEQTDSMDRTVASLSTGEESWLQGVPERYRALALAASEWWRRDAQAWWSGSGRAKAACDDQGEPVGPGEGFKTGRRLLCKRCAERRLAEHVDWAQAARDPDGWIGPGVPQDLKDLAGTLSDAPSASPTAKFTMRIGSVSESRAGVMVAGSPEGEPPRVGDTVQIVGGAGTQRADIVDSTSFAGRVAYVLSGVKEGDVKQGDILQA